MKTNWEEIKQKYITTDVSCRELADEFSLKESTVSTRAQKEKWSAERRKFKQKKAKNFEENVIPKLVSIYEETAIMAATELKEEVEQTIRIRKSIDEQEEDRPEMRVRYCANNITIMLDTLEKHAHPQREEDKKDNQTVFVVGQDVKELF